MAKNFLILRPHHDVETSYLHSFSKKTIQKLKGNKLIHVSDLEGKKANRKNLEQAALKENPKLMFLNGHGDINTVLGHDDEPVLDIQNVNLTKHKIIYALACDSLIGIGNEAVKIGAKAYIGYGAKFMCAKDPSRTSSPDKDKNAEPIRTACLILIDSLLEGKTVEKSIELTKQEYYRAIRSYGTSEDDPYGDTPLVAFALTWNLECLGYVGDSKAVF